MTTPVHVGIWSDVQCPWCYIGKRRFERGARASGVPVTVTYHSFELAPDTPLDFDGTPVDYLIERKGMPRDQVLEILARVTGIAAEEGLDYDFDSVHQTNTVRAHELLHLAKAHALQEPMKERLLRAYFVEGCNLGQVDELAALGAEIGLEEGEIRAALLDRRYLADVRADSEQARAYGITGVPFYVVDGRYGVSGAQPAEVFEQVLRQAAADA